MLTPGSESTDTYVCLDSALARKGPQHPSRVKNPSCSQPSLLERPFSHPSYSLGEPQITPPEGRSSLGNTEGATGRGTLGARAGLGQCYPSVTSLSFLLQRPYLILHSCCESPFISESHAQT